MEINHYYIYGAIILITILITYFILTRNCKKVDNSDTAKCLLRCDGVCDMHYTKCDPKDDYCIRQCYEAKSKCYMECLKGHFIDNGNGNGNGSCGCT